MFEKIKKIFWVIIFFFYTLVFRKKPGPIAMNFIKGLGFVFSGLVLSKIFSLIFQIMSGRLLGRIEYGKFALISSLSNILWIFMYLAIGTAMVKYLASARNEKEKIEIMSTAIIMTLALTIISSFIFYLVSAPLALALSISLPYIFASIIMSIGLNIWVFAQKVCQGLNRMKKIGALNAVWSLSVLILSLVLYLYTRTAIVPIASTVIGYIIPSIFIIPDIRRYFRPRFSRKWSKTLIKYGLVGALGTISFSSIGIINKIFLNVFLSMGDVGMYQAYYYSTLIVATLFVTGFVMVFFPMSSVYKKKDVIFSRMNKLLKFLPVFYVLLFAISSVILVLYGSEYTFIPSLLILFVLGGMTTIVHSLYAWFAASFGIRGIKISSISIGIICLINIVTALLLIPQYGLYGAILSIIISYIIGTFYIYFRIRRVLVPQSIKENGG